MLLGGPDEAHEYFFKEHPFVKHLRKTGEVPALRLTDLISRNKYRETALYLEAYRGFGVEYQMGFTLPSPSPQFSVGMAFNRKYRDFSEDERLIFELLRPHLFQAYRNAELVTQLQEQREQSTLALKSNGQIGFCSTRARDCLCRHFGAAALKGRRLPEILRRWLRRQESPATKNNSLPPPRHPFITEHDGRQLTIRLLPDATPGGRILVFEERSNEPSFEPLRRLGLTARQAEVLLWVMQGKTNPEIGIILGLSSGTVHKHLEHIFVKLNVETRTAAAMRAIEALAEF